MSDREEWEFGVPDYVEHVLSIHDDYVTALETWEAWSAKRRGKIMLWNTIRGLLLRSVDQNWADRSGLPSTAELLDALSLSEHLDLEANLVNDFNDKEFARMMYTAGFETSDGLRELLYQLHAHQRDQDMLARVRATYPRYKGTYVAEFISFGWQLAGRRAVVEYHAQQLRLHLQDAVPADAYEPISLDDLDDEGYRESLFANDAVFLDDDRRPSYGGSSPFWKEFAKLAYTEQLMVLIELTTRLSESNLGKILITELIFGEYDCYPLQPFKLRYLFENAVELSPASTVDKQAVLTGDGKLAGFNQHVFRLCLLAVQVAPGYARAVADESDAAKLDALEQEIGHLLAPFVADGSTDMATLQKLQQNGASKADVVGFVGTSADKVFGTLAQSVIDGYRQSAGFGEISNEALQPKFLEALPKNFKPGVLIQHSDELPKASLTIEASRAYRRVLLGFKTVKSAFGVSLLLIDNKQNHTWEDAARDLKSVLDLKDAAEFIHALNDDPIDWRGLSTEGGLGSVKAPTQAALVEHQEVLIKDIQQANLTGGVLPRSLLTDAKAKLATAEEIVDLATTNYERLAGPNQEFDWLNRYKLKQAKAHLSEASRAADRVLDTPPETKIDGQWFRTQVDEVTRRLDQAIENTDMVLRTFSQAGDPTEAVAESRVASLLTRDGETTPAFDRNRLRTLRTFSSELAADADEIQGITVQRYLTVLGVNADELDRELEQARTLLGKYNAGEKTLTDLDDVRTRVGDTAKVRAGLRRFGIGLALGVAGGVVDIVDIYIHGSEMVDAIGDYDSSVAAGHAFAGLGTAAMLFTGPVFWVGLGVLMIGVALISFTQDSPIETWLQFTYFGKHADDVVEDPKDIEHMTGLWGRVVLWALHFKSNALSATGEALVSREELVAALETDVPAYWDRQLAGYYGIGRPFEVTGAKVVAAADGYPRLVVDVEKVTDLGYGSVLLFVPIVRAPGDVWRAMTPLKLPLRRDMETHVDYTVTETVHLSNTTMQLKTPKVDLRNQNATFQRTKLDTHTAYRAVLRKSENSLVGLTVTVRLNDAWREQMTGPNARPLNDLLNYGATDVTEAEFGLDAYEKVLEVYHVPPDLADAVAGAADIAGLDLGEMQAAATENPMAPRRRKRIDVAYDHEWTQGGCQ